MSTKYLSLYDSCEWKIIKEIRKHFPDIVILIFSYTLVIEAITLSDRSRFVISSQNSDSVFISKDN